MHVQRVSDAESLIVNSLLNGPLGVWGKAWSSILQRNICVIDEGFVGILRERITSNRYFKQGGTTYRVGVVCSLHSIYEHMTSLVKSKFFTEGVFVVRKICIAC